MRFNIFFIAFFFLLICRYELFAEDPEENMNCTEIIRYHGYPAEEYNVTTEDGYILTLVRIPYGRNSIDNSVQRKTPILLMHCLLCSFCIWVSEPPYKNLAYLLAEEDYDVWLGNVRGNTYGRHHTNLSAEDPEFWMFSLDEMGSFDVPAFIDFILDKTGSSRLHYIGFSMGTTISFIMLSTRPEYNEKLLSIHEFGPVGKLDHNKSPVALILTALADQFYSICHALNIYELFPFSILTELYMLLACQSTLTTETFCWIPFHLAFGVDFPQANLSRYRMYVRFCPAGTSLYTLYHFGQIYKNRRFQSYDYGSIERNRAVYEQDIPPEYNLSRITAPIALYWGDDDWLAQPQDVAYLVENIPKESLILNYRVPLASWTHADYVLAHDVIPLLYDKVFETLELFKSDK